MTTDITCINLDFRNEQLVDDFKDFIDCKANKYLIKLWV